MMRKLLLTAFITILYFNVSAQQDSTKLVLPPANVDFTYNRPEKYVVEDVIITGLDYLNPAQIESIAGIVKGDTILIPGQDLQFLMKKLWMQRIFSDVELRGLNVNGDKVTLQIHLQERPRVSSWDYTGVRKGEKDPHVVALIYGIPFLSHTHFCIQKSLFGKIFFYCILRSFNSII